MNAPDLLSRQSRAGPLAVLVRAAAGLLLHGVTGFGRPALIDRRTGTVRRP